MQGLTAQILFFAIMGIVSLVYDKLGWQFALGSIIGTLVTFVTLRMHYGRWL